MPQNLVQGPEDERLWSAAKEAARKGKHPPENFYALVTHIFERMKKAKDKGAKT